MVVPCTAKTAQHQRNFGSTLSRYIMRPIAVAARLHRLATRRRESFEGVQRGNARRRSAFPRRDRNVRSRNGHLEGGVATGMLGEETGRSRRWRFFFFLFFVCRPSLFITPGNPLCFSPRAGSSDENSGDRRGRGRRRKEKREKMGTQRKMGRGKKNSGVLP